MLLKILILLFLESDGESDIGGLRSFLSPIENYAVTMMEKEIEDRIQNEEKVEDQKLKDQLEKSRKLDNAKSSRESERENIDLKHRSKKVKDFENIKRSQRIDSKMKTEKENSRTSLSLRSLKTRNDKENIENNKNTRGRPKRIIPMKPTMVIAFG